MPSGHKRHRDGEESLPFYCARCKPSLGRVYLNTRRFMDNLRFEPSDRTEIRDAIHGDRNKPHPPNGINFAQYAPETARLEIICPHCRASYVVTDDAVRDTFVRVRDGGKGRIDLAEVRRNPRPTANMADDLF